MAPKVLCESILRPGFGRTLKTKEGGNFPGSGSTGIEARPDRRPRLADQRGLPISPLEKAARRMPQNQRTGPALTLPFKSRPVCVSGMPDSEKRGEGAEVGSGGGPGLRTPRPVST